MTLFISQWTKWGYLKFQKILFLIKSIIVLKIEIFLFYNDPCKNSLFDFIELWTSGLDDETLD